MKKRIGIIFAAALAIAPALLRAAAPERLRIIKSFEPAPEFSITSATIIEVDTASFKFAAVSARKAAGKSRTTVRALKKLLPGRAVLMNAGFFDPKTGALIGEFVEGGTRPGGVIYAPGGHLDRIFIVRKDGGVDVLNGGDKLSAAELAEAEYAVAGKSAWPGHDDPTNRTALCITASGKVLLAAVYPVRTLERLFAFMKSQGCLPEKTLDLDGGGSTQMAYSYGGSSWEFGWERKGPSVPECHLARGNGDARCYRPVATFLTVEPRRKGD